MHVCIQNFSQELKIDTHLFCVFFKLSSSLVRRARVTLTSMSRPAHQTERLVSKFRNVFILCLDTFKLRSLQLKMYTPYLRPCSKIMYTCAFSTGGLTVLSGSRNEFIRHQLLAMRPGNSPHLSGDTLRATDAN